MVMETCDGDDVEADKAVEADGGPLEDPVETKGKEASLTTSMGGQALKGVQEVGLEDGVGGSMIRSSSPIIS